jgi:hypothetical protein
MTDVPKAIEPVWKIESTRLIAGIARVTHDIGIAEELAQDALVTALELRPEEGIPIEIVGTPTFRHYSSVDVPYLSRCRQRTLSFWDCYYRGAISRSLDYPGFRVIDAAIRAAKG